MNKSISLNELFEIIVKLENDYNNALENKINYTNSSIRNLRQRINCYKAILNRKKNID